MNTTLPFKSWIILLAMHTCCQAEPHQHRVILLPPEKLGYILNPAIDPFAENSPVYLAVKQPLKEFIQDRIAVRIPDNSTIFYDTQSRALSVSSTETVIDAISTMFRPTNRPNVTVEVITHETQPHDSTVGTVDGASSKQPTIISRDRFQVSSAGTGSLRIKTPESISKSGQLEFQIVPTVNEEMDMVVAEISLSEDANSPVSKDLPVSPHHLKTVATLKFNTTTTVYEHRLPSGRNFGISVRLIFQAESSFRPDAKPTQR